MNMFSFATACLLVLKLAGLASISWVVVLVPLGMWAISAGVVLMLALIIKG